MTSTATAPPLAGASMVSPSLSSPRLAGGGGGGGGKVAPTWATSIRCVNWSQQARAVPDRASNSCPSCRFATRSCSSSPSSSSSSFSSLPRSAGDYSPHGSSEVHRAKILVPAAAAAAAAAAATPAAKSISQCRRKKLGSTHSCHSSRGCMAAAVQDVWSHRHRVPPRCVVAQGSGRPAAAICQDMAAHGSGGFMATALQPKNMPLHAGGGCMVAALQAEDTAPHGRGRRRHIPRSCIHKLEGITAAAAAAAAAIVVARSEKNAGLPAKAGRFFLPTPSASTSSRRIIIPGRGGFAEAAAAASAVVAQLHDGHELDDGYFNSYYSYGGEFPPPPRSRRRVKVSKTLLRCAISSIGGASSSPSPSSSSSSTSTSSTSTSSSFSSVSAETLPSLGEMTVQDFPILNQEVNGRKIVYLDNAATSQKPRQVIDAVQRYYEDYNSNVHRGIHTLSVKATEAYEEARGKLARFINAEKEGEVIYTRNATEAINLVANSWGLANLTAGDEIVLSVMEHHSNLVPWQIVAQKTGAVLRFVSLDPQSESLDMDHLRSLVGNKTKLVALQHVSNALGCVNDVVAIGEIARNYGAKLMVDGCQSVPHMPIDVRALNCDWFVGSGHKMCGPTGIGFLYGKMEVLKSMPPFLGGGEMIQDVYLDHSTYADPPNRFEAGTPAIGEAIGLGAACDYLMGIGMDKIHDYEVELSEYLYEKMMEVEGLKIYGPKPTDPRGRAALCAFNVGDIHPTDLSMILDQSGFAIRSGHHCAQPLHRHFGINASARASLYFYNTKEEIDMFIEGLKEAIQFFDMTGAT